MNEMIDRPNPPPAVYPPMTKPIAFTDQAVEATLDTVKTVLPGAAAYLRTYIRTLESALRAYELDQDGEAGIGKQNP